MYSLFVLGPPSNKSQSKPVLAHKLPKEVTKSDSSPKLLGPLVIDISQSSSAEQNKPDNGKPKIDQQQSGADSGLVKTVDMVKNASVPKDNVIAGSLITNTPPVLPPLRKASSTPRRNSHIRVLDFTTPRRILHDTIDEVVSNETDDKCVEVVDVRSPNLIFSETGNDDNNLVDMRNIKIHSIGSCHYSKVTMDVDNKQPVVNNKNNWDADLRVLATASGYASRPPVKPKPKPRKSRSKKAADKSALDKTTSDKADKTADNLNKTTGKDDKAEITTDKANKTTDNVDKTTDKADKTIDTANKTEEKRPRSKRKIYPKPKKSKKRQKLEEEEEQYAKTELHTESKVIIKPSFNVVAANTYIEPQEKVPEVNQNKSNNEDNETPEAERLSLHNEIGSRLNISEFLETPYKQVLYDIQMETPKFLNSVLPDEPVSDIKIMSIPTPRFFDTPKLMATPSSYSSRPTDYSSGGSYYKPDDQDYLRITDLECPVTSSKEVELEVVKHVEVSKETAASSKKSSRPVRKCTKNVSYVSNCNVGNKSKAVDDKVEIASSSSDTTILNSSSETNKEVNVKTPKNSKLKPTTKSESSKKKIESVKKRKSPLKKDKSNSFMKIKPRRPTPTKASANKRKKEIFSPNKSQANKKITARESNIHITVVTPAPTKSRRKSSTPRKIHCTKIFNCESSGHESPDINASVKQNVARDQNTAAVLSPLDSDTDQIALRWSDDGSQDTKAKEAEIEDISKIQQYINNSISSTDTCNDNAGSLHADLVKRGFDVKTAKIIERDLMDSPAETARPTHVEVTEPRKEESVLNKNVEINTSVTSELQIVQDVESDDEFELSVFECNEDSHNYIKCNSDTKDRSKQQPVKLKDKFTLEVCIDDGVPIRLRATDFSMLYSNDPECEGELGYSFRETEVAVSSISNIEKLYTPMKDHKAQCYDIFDSTLTSLDTPLKSNSPSSREHKVTELEIVLEEEKVEVKDKANDVKKRKRLQGSNSSEEALNESKRTKPEAQYLFNSTNIQDIDIESVLKKLHGP